MLCRKADRRSAKYRLLHIERTHLGADNTAFNAIRQCEDPERIKGIRLDRAVVPTAAKALTTNIRMLAPHILSPVQLVWSLLGLSDLGIFVSIPTCTV